MGGVDLESTSTCASGLMVVKDIFTNGAMTIVHPRQGRWAAALVPVLSGRRWVTACRLVSFDQGLFDQVGNLNQ